MNELKALQSDPRAYLSMVRVETDGGARPWGAVADPWQRADGEAILPALLALVVGDGGGSVIRRAWWERGRGHAKTSDYAMLLVWVFAFSRRRRRGVWCAADADQGLLGLAAVKVLAQHNPWIESLLDIKADRIVNKHTDSVLEFITSDAATSWGETPDVVVADELVYWRKRDLFDSLFSAAGKRRDCIFLVGTNAGWKTGWQWKLRQQVARDPAWYFSALPDCCASWIDAARLAEQERILPPLVFLRAWRNRWSDQEGDALTEAEIDRCVTLSGPPPIEEGWCRVAGLDLGISHHSSALVVLEKHIGRSTEKRKEREIPRHVALLQDLEILDQPQDEYETEYVPGTGRLRVCSVRVWRPAGGQKIDLQDVEDAVVEAHSRFGLAAAGYDPYQCEHLAQRARRAGVPMEAIPPGPRFQQENASELLQKVKEGRIELYDDPTLLADMKVLRVKETQYGYRLTAPEKASGDRGEGSGHADTASALQIALYCAKRAQPSSAAHLGSLVYN